MILPPDPLLSLKAVARSSGLWVPQPLRFAGGYPGCEDCGGCDRTGPNPSNPCYALNCTEGFGSPVATIAGLTDTDPIRCLIGNLCGTFNGNWILGAGAPADTFYNQSHAICTIINTLTLTCGNVDGDIGWVFCITADTCPEPGPPTPMFGLGASWGYAGHLVCGGTHLFSLRSFDAPGWAGLFACDVSEVVISVELPFP